MSTKKTTPKKTPAKKATAQKKEEGITPLLSSFDESFAGVTQSRRNKAGSIDRTDKYKNIDDGLVPFKTGNYGGTSTFNVRDAVKLCQKAYYNFSIFRHCIDMMTELSVSPIYYQGGTKKSREFFEAFFNKIDISSLQDQFFREYYRSGNVFVYRFDARLKAGDVKRITQLFADDLLPLDPKHKPGRLNFNDKNIKKNIVPSKYVILNPADIQMSGNITFSSANYKKVLSDYELQRLRNPKTDEDREVLSSFDKTTRELIENRSVNLVAIPLDPTKFLAVFYKKQDYEPFAVPMGFPVLEDLNFKKELKNMDMAIARTMQQAILLVTMGTDPEKGGINQKNLEAMQVLFSNQSIGRVLISDYTTKAEFVIPQIGDLLDPKKYETVDRDINLGLSNMFTSGQNEKFANQQAKIEVFIARLEQARSAFINDFLLDEIKRISKSLGFKGYPTPHFRQISLRDNVVKDRVYTRLLELGVLTPEETFDAIDKGILPNKENALKGQEEMRELRDKGYYEPLMGGPNTQMEMQKTSVKSQEKMSKEKAESTPPAAAPNGVPGDKPAPKNGGAPGRPPGAGEGEKRAAPRESQRIGVKTKAQYDFTKIKDNMMAAQRLEGDVASHLRKKHGVKRLTNKQKEIVDDISSIIVSNENPEDWNKNIEKYCENPQDRDKERVKEIMETAAEHHIDMYLASLLYASKV